MSSHLWGLEDITYKENELSFFSNVLQWKKMWPLLVTL